MATLVSPLQPLAAQASGPSDNRILNYQIRLTSATGVPVANGTQDLKLTIYDTAGGATRLFSACASAAGDPTSTPTAVVATFLNGTSTILLGDSANLTCDSGFAQDIPAALFNNTTMYLGVTVDADAEMTPRKRIVSAGYAMNADRLDDLESSAVGGTAAYVPVTDAAGLLSLTGNPTTTAAVITANPVAAANELLLDLKNTGTSRFSVDGEGDVIATGSVTLAGDLAVNGDDITADGTLSLQSAGAGTTGRVQIGAGGAGSATPDIFGLDVKSTTGDPATTVNGAMYYNEFSDKFRCYENGAWVDCVSAATAVNSFVTWDAPSGTDPVADNATDTMTLTAGAGMTITGDATGDSLAFALDGDLVTIAALTSSSGQMLVYNGAWTAVSLSGDVTTSATGVTAVGANAVALGTDTTGNYVANVTASAPLAVTGTPGEAWTANLTCATCLTTGTTLFSVAAEAGTPETVLSGSTVTFVGGVDLDSVVSATDTVTFNNTSTLASVTGRGATTTTLVNLNGGIATTGDLALNGGDMTSTAASLVLTADSAGTPGSCTIDTAGNFACTGVISGATVGADSLDYVDFQDTMDYDAPLIVNQGTNTWTQNYTGTTTGIIFNAASLTTGAGLLFTTVNAPTTNAAAQGMFFSTNFGQSTVANTAGFYGTNLQFTSNPSIAGNTESGVLIRNGVTPNTIDTAVNALLVLDNADTSASGSTTVTNAIQITASGALATPFTNFLDTPTIDISAAGAITGATYNGLSIVPTTGTLGIAAGKSLLVNNTLALAGTDGTTMTFPTTSATIARTDAGQTFTGINNFTSPNIATSLTTGSASFDLLGSATTIDIAGGSGATGCTVDGATGNLTCTGVISGSGGTAFVQNGNSFAAPAVLGTNDANTLSFETGNTTWETISTTGQRTLAADTNYTLTGGVNGLSFDGTTFSVDSTNDRIGIGTAAPTGRFHVVGGTQTAGSNATPITILGQATSDGFTGGAVVISAGANGTGAGVGGGVSISAGNAGGSNNGNIGGDVTITSGGAFNGQAGNILIQTADARYPAGGLITLDSSSNTLGVSPITLSQGGVLRLGIDGFGHVNVGANSNLVMTSGTGVFTQTNASANAAAAVVTAHTTTVTDTGVVTTGTDTTVGHTIAMTRTGATGGTISTTGLNITATGDNAGAGTSTVTGVNIAVSGTADTSYSLISTSTTANVGIGDASPAALLTVGAGDAFQVNSAGSIAAVVNITSSGRIDTAAHAANVGLNIPTSAGAPIGVTGSADGDIVVDTTGNSLYFRSGGAWRTASGANTALSNLASVAINTSLLPGVDDTIDLGSDTLRWANLWLGGETIHIGTSVSDEATIGYITANDTLLITANATTASAATILTGTGGFTVGTSGASTFNSIGLNLSNTTTNVTTDGLNKYGMLVLSVGTWTGGAGAATSNYGVYIDTVSGADSNYALVSTSTTANVGIGDVTPASLFTVGAADAFQVNSTGSITASVNITSTGRVDTAAHAANVGLNIPTSAGAPIAVTGTAEGDIVWDATNNVLYAYDGAAFVNTSSAVAADSLDYDDFEDIMDLDAGLTLNQAGFSSAQTFTGTTTNMMSYTSNTLTSGKMLELNSTNAGFFSNVLDVNAAATGSFGTAVGSGAVNFSFSGAHTGNAFQIDDSTVSGTAMQLNANTATSGKAMVIASNALTSGEALTISSSSNTMSSANMIVMSRAPTASTTTFSGELLKISETPTFNSGLALSTSGNSLDVTRNIVLNNATEAHTVSGDLVQFTDDVDVTLGTLTAHTANVLQITQQNTTGTGALMLLDNAGVGWDIQANSWHMGNGASAIANDPTVNFDVDFTDSGALNGALAMLKAAQRVDYVFNGAVTSTSPASTSAGFMNNTTYSGTINGATARLESVAGSFTSTFAGVNTLNGQYDQVSVHGISQGDIGTAGVTSHVGGWFDAFGTADANYGIYIGAASGATSNWSLFSSGASDSYFGGDVGLGDTSPDAKLDVVGDVLVSGDLMVGTGTTALPTIGFASDNTTGLSAAGGFLDMSVGGLHVARYYAIGTSFFGPVDLSLNVTATTNGLCHSGGDVDVATVTNRAIAPCSAAPGDVAEWFDTVQGTNAGDIVALTDAETTYSSPGVNPMSGTLTNTETALTVNVMTKSTAAYQGNIIGIVSTSPAQSYGKALIKVANFPRPIAVAGRVPTRVSTENGPILPGDAITSSSVAGVGMKATVPGRIVGYALTGFNESTEGKVVVHVAPGWHGGDIDGGITVDGNFVTDMTLGAATAATEAAQLVDSEQFAFVGSVWDPTTNTPSSRSVLLFTDMTERNVYGLRMRASNGTNIAYFGQNGDVQIGGGLFPSDNGTMQSAKFIDYDGESDMMRTNAAGWVAASNDFAEMMPSKQNLKAGELVMIDTLHDTRIIRGVRDASHPSYLLAGVISARPGFLAGMQEEGSFPVAIAGRVKTKVSIDNGKIAVGDAITVSSVPGVGVKATDSTYVVGIALEAYSGGDTGSITVFVKPGWWQNGEIQQASSEVSGNVGSGTLGVDGLWNIDAAGVFSTSMTYETTIETAGVTVTTYSAQTTSADIILSGSGAMKNGRAVVPFTDTERALIDGDVDLRVSVTMTDEISGFHVTNKSPLGFTVVENQGGTSEAGFDWVVVVRREGYGDAVSEPKPESEPVVEPPVKKPPVKEPPAKEPIPVDPKPTCSQLGGTWKDDSCVMSSSKKSNPPVEEVLTGKKEATPSDNSSAVKGVVPVKSNDKAPKTSI